jgi:hypothetical protein
MRIVMQPNWNNMTSNTAMVGGRKRPDGPDFGIVCPSVCLSDWDKRETPVRKRCLTTTCDGRQNKQRRGQDSNLRTSYPVTDLANPRFRPLSHLSGCFFAMLTRRPDP